MTRQLVAATFALPRDAKIVDVDTAARRLWTVLGDERTVVVTDTTSGEEVGRRTFDGFRWPERFGEHLVLQGADGGFAVAPADLSKNAEWLLREGRLLRGVGAGVAHITVEEKEAHGDSIRFRFGRVAVDLASRSVLRQTEETAGSWQVPDPERDLALNVVGGRIDAYRSTSGEALFSVEPFEGTPINSIDGAMLLGERLHVRASTIDEDGRSARVVMLDPRTGKAVGPIRRSSDQVPAWIGDYGDEVEALTLELDGFAHRLLDGIALEQDDQLVIVRPTSAGPHVQRVAKPRMRGTTIRQGVLFGVAEVGDGSEAMMLAVPDRSEGELFSTRLEPRGPLVVAGGDTATVAFVGSSVPYVVAVHEKHGRINLPRGEEHAGVKKGDQVLLVDLSVKPGGVVSVGAWHVGGARPARAAVELEAGPERKRVREKRGGRPHLLEPLLARAEAAGVSLPAAIVALVARVEESEPLRSALADAGFFFAETDLGLDTLADLDEEEEMAFVPIWGNGYEDAIGGVIPHREGLVIVHLPERDVVEAGPDIVSVIRKKLEDSDDNAATRALVERTLLDIVRQLS